MESFGVTATSIFQEWTLDAGEVKINYAEFENYGLPQLFIHGVTSAWGGWSGLKARLILDIAGLLHAHRSFPI